MVIYIILGNPRSLTYSPPLFLKCSRKLRQNKRPESTDFSAFLYATPSPTDLMKLSQKIVGSRS